MTDSRTRYVVLHDDQGNTVKWPLSAGFSQQARGEDVILGMPAPAPATGQQTFEISLDEPNLLLMERICDDWGFDRDFRAYTGPQSSRDAFMKSAEGMYLQKEHQMLQHNPSAMANGFPNFEMGPIGPWPK